MTAGGEAEHHRRRPTTRRKPAPGQPWSHQETSSLLDAYEEKWHALKRGQLKAQQWEELAATIAARCGLHQPSKTGTQCRHKLEKLRQRFRDERLRSSLFPSSWPYFDRIDRMDRGCGGAAATGGSVRTENDEHGEEERAGSSTRSISGILRDGIWGLSRVSQKPNPKKKRAFEEVADENEEDDDCDKNQEPEGRGESLAAVVRGFGEGLVRMDKRRMQMMREMERDWMEMEVKRAEIVIESQRCIVGMITGAFSSLEEAKETQYM